MKEGRNRGGPSGARSRDLRIKSPQLYQLSYRPVCYMLSIVSIPFLVHPFHLASDLASHFAGLGELFAGLRELPSPASGVI